MRFLPFSTIFAAMTFLASAQEARPPAPPPAMTLTIAGFADGTQIPVKFSQAAAPASPVGEGNVASDELG